MNWRATHVLTPRRDLAIVPNSTIAKSKILNVSFPSSIHGITVSVQLDSRTPPANGTNVLELAILNSRSILAIPRPTVRVVSIDAAQTGYELTFFIEQLGSATEAQNELFDLIFRHATAAGAQLAAPKNGSYQSPGDEALKKEKTGPEIVLDLVPIFSSLMPSERAAIAAKLKQTSYETGDSEDEPCANSGGETADQQQAAGRVLTTAELDKTEAKGRLSAWFSERIHKLFDLTRSH